MKRSDSHTARFSLRRLPKWALLLPVALLLTEMAATAVHAHRHAQEDFAHPCATCALGHASATPIVVEDTAPIPAQPERVHATPHLAPVTRTSLATSSRAPPTA